MKKIIYVELVCILCIFCFLVGKEIGKKNNKEQDENQVIPPRETEQVSQVSVMEDIINEGDEPTRVQILTPSKEEETTEKREGILLVNKDNKLPDDYAVTLKTLPDGVNKAAEEAHGPLCEMLEAGRKEGLYFEICSSYRDVKRQQELFNEDLEKLIRGGYSYLEAYEEVARETMPPGHSEHSTGLAFDIVALRYQMLDSGQEKTAENKWLQEHCAEYGFILRYPKGKEEITGISYESWHFRYVGVEIAEYIMENGITLEEYIEGA